jgi:uncharacterized protein (DUF779 family)
MSPSVAATPAALDAIRRMEEAIGPLAIFQSGGCCDGSLPLCLRAEELPPGPHDLELGRIGETPFYVDADQYRRWGEPEFVVDVCPGAPEGFSLGPAEGMHFVSRPPVRSDDD